MCQLFCFCPAFLNAGQICVKIIYVTICLKFQSGYYYQKLSADYLFVCFCMQFTLEEFTDVLGKNT